MQACRFRIWALVMSREKIPVDAGNSESAFLIERQLDMLELPVPISIVLNP